MTAPSRPTNARRAGARLLTVAATALCAFVLTAALAQERELDPRVFEIGRELRCPTCVSESVAQSSSPIAREMRVIIQEQLDAGRSRTEILAFFQERYGDWILLEPPRRGLHLVVWLLPALATVTGATVLLLLIRRWRAAAARPVRASDEDLARVRDALTADTAQAPGTTSGEGDPTPGTARS